MEDAAPDRAPRLLPHQPSRGDHNLIRAPLFHPHVGRKLRALQYQHLSHVHLAHGVGQVQVEMALNRMLVNVVMEVVRESRVCVVVLDVVVYRGMSHPVTLKVIVMVMVMGPKWRHQHWQGVHRWGHREQVCSRHSPLPRRCWSCWLSSMLCVLQLPIVHWEMVE